MSSRSRSVVLPARLFSATAALAALGFALGLAGCGKEAKEAAGKPPAAKAAFQSVEQKVSYGAAYNLGADLARQPGFKADAEAAGAGLADGLGKAKSRIPEGELQAAFAALREKIVAEQAKAGEANLAGAKAFLEQNCKRPGVKTTLSGLQYEVLKSGTGRKPKLTDTVEVHYHGTLPDGTIFDSSVQRGQPVQFPVNGVIPGWTKALQLMSVGDKWKLYIPPALGYGPRGSGNIPPNSALIFEVELLGIK
ncbi:MAG: FKBP-type peptidyl-prolyl cis-trans isomerase [Opitutae bacterium]|nr:FKBP-type peptidyl-prolyl cis-trans isomerase [Opitutae bacterium]